MRENVLYPEVQKEYNPCKNGKGDRRYSKNILERKFNVKKPNKVWSGDITYIKTSVGWVYLSIVMDLFNREIVGYSVSKRINTELVKESLGNSLIGKENPKGLIFHSDRGSQYSSIGYKKMIEDNEIIASISKSGCPYDNSCVEVFFCKFKKGMYLQKRI